MWVENLSDGTPYIAYMDEANTADGSSFTLNSLDVVNDANLSDIAINPYNAAEIVLVYSNYNITGLFHSTDGGSTITAIEGNLDTNDDVGGLTGPSLRAAEIISDTSGNKKYVVATSIGVFSTESLNGNSTTWTSEFSALDNIVVADLDSRPVDNSIIAGTHGRGMFAADWSNIPNIAPEAASLSLSIQEDAVNGTVLDTLIATDEDGDELSFSISSGNPGNTFTIDDSTGVITIAADTSLNFESTESYELIVGVSDGIASTLVTVSITILDVDEAPVLSEGIVFTIDEHVPSGSIVGIITSHDPEGSSVTYSIVSGNTDDAFSINSMSGELVVDNERADRL